MNATQRLAELAATGQYLFHGSDQASVTLEPRQPYNSHPETGAVADGFIAVCATDDADHAVFMAMLSRNPYPVMTSTDGSTGVTILSASPKAREHAAARVGHIHVLHRRDFRPYRPGEWRCPHTVTPVHIVEVTIADLPTSIADLSDDWSSVPHAQ